LTQRELEQISGYLNQTLQGLSLQQVKEKILSELEAEKAQYDRLLRRTLELSKAALGEELGAQVYIEGAARILDQPEFANVERMKQLFQAFEQKSLLIELLDQSQHAEGVRIFIGSETEYSGIQGCSLISANYSSKRGTIGALGVIGPSRMNYSAVIPVVNYTARLLSQVLDADND